jgi:glycosyltransferase involved in cell wall biosynthesis
MNHLSYTIWCKNKTKRSLELTLFFDFCRMKTFVIIPALNEEQSIGLVINALSPYNIAKIIVADNGSSDSTAKVAREAGAEVVFEQERGYGAACLKALEYANKFDPDVFLFMDGDFADDATDIPRILEPIESRKADLVIGSRVLGKRERGALTIPQIIGNALATRLLKLFFGVDYTDLGPFRAITKSGLEQLNMVDRNYGWTIEMQIKAALHQLNYQEVPVNYRRRIGQSKVSGTIKGSIMAGSIILYALYKYGRPR